MLTYLMNAPMSIVLGAHYLTCPPRTTPHDAQWKSGYTVMFCTR